MPELPETETIARDLDGALRGAVVRSVRVMRADVLRGLTARAFTARVKERTVERVWRRAKSVVIEFTDAHRIVVTPRFTGALLLEADVSDAYTCVRFGLADGRVLTYRDVRRLGTVTLLDASSFAEWSASLGPEPLDPELTAERVSGILRGSKRAVKSILMDQRRLAGVGNIYANEACWLAGVRPARRGASLTLAECARLLSELRAVLTASIAVRGTTFRDFRDAYGARGGFAVQLKVYGRSGEPCARCGAVLSSTHAIEGRQTVWCPNRSCQR